MGGSQEIFTYLYEDCQPLKYSEEIVELEHKGMIKEVFYNMIILHKTKTFQ